MSLQDYDSLCQNMVASVNTRMQAVCEAVSSQLPVTTTITVTPTPTIAAFGLTSSTLIEVGQLICVEMPNGTFEFTEVTSLIAGVVTVSPVLSVAPDAGADIRLTVDWMPDGARTENPSYPFVALQFLKVADWDAGKWRFCSTLQMDVFTSRNNLQLARLIFGKVLMELGLTVDTFYQMASIPQTDFVHTPPLSLHEMDLEYRGGYELLEDPDPNVIHLFLRPKLYHE